MSTRAVRPLSLFNKIQLPLVLVAAAAATWRQQLGLAVILLLGTAYVAVAVWRAQRGLGSERERVNAVQPYDERDRELVAASFSIVGMVAFVAQTGLLVVAALTGGDTNAEGVRVLGVCVVALVATEIAVRRG